MVACETESSCSHDWEWVVTKAPTTTEAGEETQTCSLCGETASEVVQQARLLC